ncbi:MAG: outer membrane protein assembly factor BamA [Rickettsiales bacterium]|nr:outer membrane protein assembly factor BamA [Rickettsiales bacterium]
MTINRRTLAFLLCVLVFIGKQSVGKTKSPDIIRQIIVQGNKYYNSNHYMETAEVKVGDRFDEDARNNLEKKIIASGYTDRVDTKYDSKNGILSINVQERPLIGKITFTGAKELEKDDVMENIELKKGGIFSEKSLREDIDFITILYRSQGYFNVKINHEIKDLGNNLVEITMNISKGKETKIRKIYFIGNTAFGNSTLKNELFSRENKFYRFGKAINYDPNILDYDRHLLEQFYKSKGYFGIKIISAVGVYNEDENNFDLIFSLEEGKKLLFGKITIDDRVKKTDQDTLDNIVKLIKNGEVLDVNLINRVTGKLNDVFTNMGYYTISVDPEFSEAENNRVNVTFKIAYDNAEKTRYIGRIDIEGNSRTRDHVIREALDINEGDQYNEFLLDKSLNNVRNIGFFSEVDHEEKDGILENQSDLVIGVNEASTGSFAIGVAYSSLDQVNGSFGFEQANLFGKAINLATDFRISKFSKNIDFDFSKPNIFGSKVRGGVGFTFQNSQNMKNPNFKIGFDDYSVEGHMFVKFNIMDHLSQRITYRYNYSKINNIEHKNKFIFPLEARTTSEISTNLRYNGRNSISRNRGEGYVLDMDLAVGGLGGIRKYLRTVGHFTYYYPVYLDKLTLKLEAKIGYIRSLDKNNLLYATDGFYIGGGSSMRGFEYGGAGPRIAGREGLSTSSGIGGTHLYYLNGELKFPISIQKMLGLYGVFFANAGMTTGQERKNEDKDFEILDSGSPRAAIGFSLLLEFGSIEVSFDFSHILKKESYDRSETFRPNIGLVGRF